MRCALLGAISIAAASWRTPISDRADSTSQFKT